jgi:hypothetical protein
MRRVLAVFRKDARRLWPQAAAFSALLTLAALLDPTYRNTAGAYYVLLPSLLLPLSCALLIISAIQQEALPGDRQYWVTRPYAWYELLLSKFLFIAAFISLPMLVFHAVVYAAVGVPISDHLSTLLWRQIIFAAFYVLPAAALGSITRTLGKAFATGLAICTAVWFSGFLLFGVRLLLAKTSLLGWLVNSRLLLRPPFTNMGSAEALVLASGMAAVVLLQYWLRRTAVWMSAAGVVVLALMALSSRVPLSATPPVIEERHWYGFPRLEDVPTLSLDASSGRRSAMAPASDPDVLLFDIPVRIERAPAGVAFDRAYFVLSLSGRGTFHRNKPATLHDFDGDRAWLSFSLEAAELGQLGGKPVEIASGGEFERFETPVVLPLPRGSRAVVPGVGSCRDARDSSGGISFVCYSPSPRAPLMVGILGSRVNWIISPKSVGRSVPTESSFQPVTRYSSLLPYQNWEQTRGLSLVSARPLPPVRFFFRLSDVRLESYIVRGQK